MSKIPDKYRICSIYLALAIIIRLAFWQIHSFDFINYDDDAYVSKNEHISTGLKWDNVVWVFTKAHSSNWHPLTGLSHMLDCQLFGLKPGLHHLVNLLFHIANTLLLFAVLRRMTGALWRSAFVAAVFAVHPLHVESVAWISERKDVLSTLFWLLTMAAYLRYVKNPKASSYILTLVFFALGLMAKPMLVTLPFTLLLLDYWPLKRLSVKSLWEKAPFFILSAVSSAITLVVQSETVQKITVLPLSVRVANAVVSCGKYIFKMIWPTNLAVFYPHPVDKLPGWQVLASIVLLVIVTIFVIRFAKTYRYLFVGWFWYIGTLVPVIGLVQVGDQAMADRYSYIPLIGLFIIIAWGANDLLTSWKYRRIAFAITAAAVILLLSVCTWKQTSYWRNSKTLFEHTLKVTDENYVACNNLGMALMEQKKFDEAIELFHRALEVRPDLAEAYNNLGIAYGNIGRYDKAIEAYKQAIGIEPDYAEAYYNLGITCVSFGRSQDAAEAFKHAVKIKPDYADAHYNLCVAYLMTDNKNAAMEEYKILKTLDAELADQLSELIGK